MMKGMGHTQPVRVGGDADVAAVAALIGEPSRATVLMALAGGRALSASVLAAEAGLSPPAISAHLAKLAAGGLITVERAGRHRYYSLAGPDVADLVEALARLAPAAPIRSLRQGTRARALRAGRTCYDHLAGELGVAITHAAVRRGALVPIGEHHYIGRGPDEPPVGWLPNCPYLLGPDAEYVFTRLGVDLQELRTSVSRRPLLRFCMDWSEQRHHLAGRLGAALASSFIDAGWVERRSRQRAVTLTDLGTTALESTLGCVL
jgi:DNA-binding transcriptional ArsR family regulator